MSREAIEKVPPGISADYAHLFQSDVQACQSLEVDEIILKINEKAGKLQTGQKAILFDLRFFSQNMQNLTSSEKANLFRQTGGLFLEGASATCHVVSAYFGAQTSFGGGSLAAIAQGFTSANTYRDKLTQGEQESLGHSYQRQGALERDLSQNIQSAEQKAKSSEDAIERMIQNSRRQAELVAGSQ